LTEAFQVPQAPAQAEILVQKSRFLALLFPCTDPSQARELLHELKISHKDATHVVHAFICGTVESQNQGCSDDGEPSGTAGRPVLDVLKGFGATDTFVAIVRWFGGVKLGTGGLVRAYAQAARQVLESANWRVKVAQVSLRVRVSYADQGTVRRLLEQAGAALTSQDHSEVVELEFVVATTSEAELTQTLVNATQGRVVWIKNLEVREAGPS
jgi:uncharacterized YigZ family protein